MANDLIDTLEELENTPDDLLNDLPAFKPVPLSGDIVDSLNTGKEDIKPGAKDAITYDGIETTIEATETAIPATDSEEPASTTPESDAVNFALSELVDADTAIQLMELIIVFSGLLICSKFFDTEVDKSLLQFTKEEKATIKKPLEKCFKQSTVGTKNPWVALIIVLVTIMGMKSYHIYNAIKESKESEVEAEEIDDTIEVRKAKKTPSGKKPRGVKPGQKRGSYTKKETQQDINLT